VNDLFTIPGSDNDVDHETRTNGFQIPYLMICLCIDRLVLVTCMLCLLLVSFRYESDETGGID
jgi:hypothetical protein